MLSNASACSKAATAARAPRLREAGQLRPPPEKRLERGTVFGVPPVHPILLTRRHPHCQRPTHPLRDGVLQREQVLPLEVVVGAPERRPVARSHQLHTHPQAVPCILDGAGQEIIHREIATDHAQIHVPIRVAQDR